MESGKIVAFLTYFTIILNAMLSITRLFVKLSQATASAGRIMQVIDTAQTMEEVEGVYGVSENYIEFRHVSFSYPNGKQVLHDISFALRKGESLGIIGATGAGKTTVILLLMRFYEPDSGEIFVDGRNIRTMTFRELRKRFGTVFQNDTMFEDSVYENISLYRDIPAKEAEKAASYAEILDHIRSMEKGLDSAVAIKGANLSGGQKQRMLIARALAGKPEILVLDDASSALDYRTDAAVRSAIRTHFPDTTSIVVAQRVSSVMSCDQVMLLSNGHISGIGNHAKLLEHCPEYAQISRMQLEA
jgi:ATP-binding cassette subfamily B protein